MAAQPTTRWQVSGYRFLMRRMEHALVRRDVRMISDPMRSQSRAMVVGTVVACLGLAGCAALALFRPQDRIGDASVVVGRDSGALYVAIDGTFHPVLNLASARLVLGSPVEPVVVADEQLAERPRGALVGIPGAPSSLTHTSDDLPWTACDTVEFDGTNAVTTTVVVGTPDRRRNAALHDGQALLISFDGRFYLVYNGVRAEIDPEDRALTRVLGIETTRARPVSPGLLASIPEVPALTAPPVPGAGSAPNVPVRGLPVGSVVALTEPDGQSFHLVLRDGVQEVSRATAQILHASDSHGAAEIPVVPPDVLKDVPAVNELAVSTFPAVVPEIVESIDSPVACLTWDPVSDADRDRSALQLSAGTALPLADDAVPVVPAQADGAGPNADAVYIPPGRGILTTTTAVTAGSDRTGALFYVADTGVRYGIVDRESAASLGFSAEPVRAPWQMVQLLAPGPALGRAEALLAHDGVTADTGAVPVRAGG
ncbi:type VII secretion protein EccB [Rhodococcus coprophilus]|uniref:Esx cluster lipoprotein n=1 Tax=Rhodococcus coprophilus TaxID=38310 RepID=A0A2X4UFN6_9NOCA|nr:type VII secretion protein EccB [Rhodococcus coprophilus]MBM7459959.1 type VII secretion protein EccB [Rhodococcus coprophilus]SQI37783.1 esx cluster lipoprotein [Rhodococcus coprophilus]